MSCCLGIQFIRNGSKIIMHRKGYIEDILKRFEMTDSKPVGTPMDLKVKLTLPEDASDPDIQKLPYCELIGTLTYLDVATWPDIAFTVSLLS